MMKDDYILKNKYTNIKMQIDHINTKPLIVVFRFLAVYEQLT